MFKPYQSGPFVELLSAKDKPPRWRFSDRSTHQVYEKAVKGFILVLDSPSLTLTVPADPRKLLGLTQSYLVVQVHLTEGQSFSLELVLTDNTNVRRRFLLSSASRDTAVSPLHVRTPNKSIVRGEWLNLSIDLPSYLIGCFPSTTFRSLDGLVFTGLCKLRRIFTMRSPIWTSEFDVEAWEPVPKAVEFPGGTTYRNQVLRLQRISNDPPHQISVQEAPKPDSKAKPKTAIGWGGGGGGFFKEVKTFTTGKDRGQSSLHTPRRFRRGGELPQTGLQPLGERRHPARESQSGEEGTEPSNVQRLTTAETIV